MNQRDITTILQELYAIDASLKKHEKQLRDILESFIASQPAVEINEQFVRDLRQELLEQPVALHSFNFSFMTLSKYVPLVVTGLVVALIAAPLGYYFGQPDSLRVTSEQSTFKSANDSVDSGSTTITRLDDNAFGQLAPQANPAPKAAAVGERAAGFGGGGGMAISQDGQTMIAPYPITRYTYKYRGDDFTIPSELPVYKQVAIGAQAGVTELLADLSRGLFNPRSFGTISLENMNVLADNGTEYNININAFDGMLSINQRYYGEFERELRPIRPSEVPADADLISLVQKFLNKHGISTAGYGDPEVNKSWGAYAARSEGSGESYVPDIHTVTFPLLIDGQPVIDQGGTAFGLSAQVNIRTNTVININAPINPQFTSSQYDMVTDVEALVRQYNTNNSYPVSPDSKITEYVVELGTPTIGVMPYWYYKEGASMRLYVPALIMPVINKPADVWHSDVLVIPLPQELQNQDPPIMIMETPPQTGQPEPLPAIEELELGDVETIQ